ncbi:MAG: formylglycine-generating enzyme family protein [Treponema sp.]|nr:formylglycine-generating enzyme family protein [Treponema sp.]
MKKIVKFIGVLVLAFLSFALISCGHDKDFGQGDVVKKGIKINGKVLSNTSEVCVTPKKVTITGATPDFIDEHTADKDKGVLVEGRTVTLSPFVMGKYEVTQELYEAVMSGMEGIINPAPSSCYNDPYDDDIQELRPVEQVSWNQAAVFCNRLSEKEGYTKAYDIEIAEDGFISVTFIPGTNGYRLPTEAEWEFAARGGNPLKADWNYAYSGSNNCNDVGWTDANSSDITHQTGKKKPNRLGIYDMTGNVFEWCQDYAVEFDDLTGNDTNPWGSENGTYKVERGGSYRYGNVATVTFRFWHDGSFSCYPYTEDSLIGFRVVRSIK